MAREATQEGKKPQKEKKKNLRTRFIATFLTWILLNLIWMYFSHAIAVNEVNKHDREVNGKYVLDVPNLFGLDRETPIDVKCDFKKKNSTVPTVTVRIHHEVNEGELLLIWEGNSTDDCYVDQMILPPGKHTFHTTVIIDGEADVYPSNYISAEMELGMHLWEPFRTEGFVVANLLGLFLGIADRAIREIMRRRKESRRIQTRWSTSFRLRLTRTAPSSTSRPARPAAHKPAVAQDIRATTAMPTWRSATASTVLEADFGATSPMSSAR